MVEEWVWEVWAIFIFRKIRCSPIVSKMLLLGITIRISLELSEIIVAKNFVSLKKFKSYYKRSDNDPLTAELTEDTLPGY